MVLRRFATLSENDAKMSKKINKLLEKGVKLYERGSFEEP